MSSETLLLQNLGLANRLSKFLDTRILVVPHCQDLTPKIPLRPFSQYSQLVLNKDI